MVCAATAAATPETPAPVGWKHTGISQCDRRRGAEAKTGLRAATGADGVAGFQQRADRACWRTPRCCWARRSRIIRGGGRLLEVEKSAARAAEIASELAQFSRQEKESRRAPAGNLNAVVGRCVDFFRNANGPRGWQLALTPERAV
jgi:hypothetical protein